MSLKDFLSLPECPKCGGSMSMPRYVQACLPVVCFPEKLVRTCTTCGFKTSEPCKDAKRDDQNRA